MPQGLFLTLVGHLAASLRSVSFADTSGNGVSPYCSATSGCVLEGSASFEGPLPAGLGASWTFLEWVMFTGASQTALTLSDSAKTTSVLELSKNADMLTFLKQG